MKAKVSDSKFGMSITLTPETMQEVKMLLRYAKNKKAEKPSVHFSFSDSHDDPYLNVYLNKIHESKQSNGL